MKSNSNIVIWIMSVILILWITFLFIEPQNKYNTHKQTIQKTEENTDQTQSDKKDIVDTKQKEPKKITKNTIIQNEQKNQTYNQNTQITKPAIIPTKYNIQNIDFFSQAPYGDRKEPYQDACEEASLLIGYYYLNNIQRNKKEYNADLLKMIELEMKMLGYFESTTIMEMKQIINTRDRNIKTNIIEHPTIRDIEKEISQNNIVIAPFYGKGLKNPHYALGGPEYHFLVIKGYNQTNFITHDVGTIHGENREYAKSTIMDNIHDRNRTNVKKGAPRILILKK